MKYLPESLAEALALRHGHAFLPLFFSKDNATEDCIVLVQLPEIDLILEDHGHYIFGLNLSLSSLKEYLDGRDQTLANQLLPITNLAGTLSVLGEILTTNNLPGNVCQCLSGCEASLKTYDGSSGRNLTFRTGGDSFQISDLEPHELPMLILIPK